MKSLPDISLAFLTSLFFLIPATTDAQTRYKDIVFSAVTVTDSIPFGANQNIDASTASLSLDFYQPSGDTLTARPLVICIHGGSLTAGNRIDMGAFCSDFALRGYVSATIDYRLGIESPKGVRTIEEALLRGVQDTKAAVRFFRAHAALYGIDTTQIYLEGSSAGSMIADHYAYWNENEIPGDVDQVKWGDIEGTSGNPGYSSAINGIINYCGALVNPTWIDSGEVPVANFHGLLDTVVPPDSGVSGDFGIWLYGGVAISRNATRLGIYNQGAFFPNMGHGGNEDSLRRFSSNFLYSLMVLASAVPQDFSSMTLSARALKIFRYDNFTFGVSAMHKSGNTIILPQSMVQYSCDTRVGTITSYGLFTPSDHADSGYVYAKFNNATDSCYVKTYDFKYFILRPKLVVSDTLKTLKMWVDTYDADSVKHDLALSRFTLTSSDPSVGSIDAGGTFTPKKAGTTRVVAAFNNYSDTSVVRVEIARGLVTFDSLESLNGWTFSGLNLDSLSVTLATDQKSLGSASFLINYAFTYDVSKLTYMVYLNKDVVVYGIPDSMFLDVKSDGRNHRLYYRFSDAESQLFRASGKKYLNSTTTFDNINAPLTGMSPLTGVTVITYPLTFRRIEIQLAGNMVQGQTTSGAIYIDNLRIKYPGTVTGVEPVALIPSQPRLEQNYPNPFNPSTTIRYQLPASAHVTLKMFDLLGREVGTLINGRQSAGLHSVNFNAGSLPSGVYFYRIEAGTYLETKKLILLK